MNTTMRKTIITHIQKHSNTQTHTQVNNVQRYYSNRSNEAVKPLIEDSVNSRGVPNGYKGI